MVSLPKCAQSTCACSPGKRAQPQIRFAGRSRPQSRDDGAEMIGGAGIAALAHHRVQPRGAQRRVLGEGLDDEREVRLDHRGTQRLVRRRHPGLGEHATHGAVMHAQLRRDGADRPAFGCDAGAGSRLRARAGSSPGPRVTVLRATDRAARSAEAARPQKQQRKVAPTWR